MYEKTNKHREQNSFTLSGKKKSTRKKFENVENRWPSTTNTQNITLLLLPTDIIFDVQAKKTKATK